MCVCCIVLCVLCAMYCFVLCCVVLCYVVHVCVCFVGGGLGQVDFVWGGVDSGYSHTIWREGEGFLGGLGEEGVTV